MESEPQKKEVFFLVFGQECIDNFSKHQILSSFYPLFSDGVLREEISP